MIAEVAEIFAFMMAFALLESLALTAFVVLLSAILPSGWLRDGFALKGLIFVMATTVASVVYQKLMPDELPALPWLITGLAAPVLLFAALTFIVRSRPKLQDLLLKIQDRISILLFIYVPLGIVSLIAFLYRNLLYAKQ
jgi:hypothetical protein